MKHTYVYKITEKSSGRYYIGYRTCPADRKPLDDLGTIYFTSGSFKESFKKFPDQFDKEILEVFNNKIDGYLYEQTVIKSNFKSRNCVNKMVDEKSLKDSSKVRLSPEFNQEIINLSRSKRGKAKRKEIKRLKRVKQYERMKRHFIQYCCLETRNIITIIP